MKQRFEIFLAACGATAMVLAAATASAQVTVAAGYTPPDDEPHVNVGGTIFADYTYQQEPTTVGSDGGKVHPNAFNLTRAYINITGQINHLIAFRITPDVVRVGTVAGVPVPGITNTLTYRLKYAFGQVNFSDFTTKGSWLRLGLQQTPYIDYEEGKYRYRFQGPIMVDREGYLTSSDLGASIHWNIPHNFGDVHVGVYNGEGYANQVQDRDSQVAFQVRGTIRPMPDIPILKGIYLTGFYDSDHYLQSAKKERYLFNFVFENPNVNFGFTYAKRKDQTTPGATIVDSEGYSIWCTPRTPFGLEALIRWDRYSPDLSNFGRKQRLIVGPAYWFPVTKKGVAAAVLLDFEQVRYMGLPSSNPTEERYSVHTLFNF